MRRFVQRYFFETVILKKKLRKVEGQTELLEEGTDVSVDLGELERSSTTKSPISEAYIFSAAALSTPS